MNVVIFTDVNEFGYLKYAGPYKIATELRQHGYTVQVVDNFCKYSFVKTQKILNKFITNDTLWIGFSTTFTPAVEKQDSNNRRRPKRQNDDTSIERVLGRKDIEQVIQYAKDLNPNLKVVVGGANARLLKQDPNLDHVILGQGETSTVAITNSIKNNEPIKKILSETDFPYEGFTTSTIEYQPQDIIFPGEHLSIEFSRGCIFKCKFCNYPLLGKKLWDFVKSPKLIAQEIQRNYDLFSTQGYMIADDTVNDSVEKVEALHKELTQLPFKLTLSAYARVDLIIAHPHTLDLMYEMGFRSLFFGVESFNYETAKAIGKGMPPEKIKQGLIDIKARYPDILITLAIIFGLPHETRETMEEAIEYFKTCPADNITVSPYFINPESTIGQNPSTYGYVVNGPKDWTNEYTSWAECEELTNKAQEVLGPKNKLSWIFLNRVMNCGFTQDYCATHTMKEAKEEVVAAKKELIQKYYKQLMLS